MRLYSGPAIDIADNPNYRCLIQIKYCAICGELFTAGKGNPSRMKYCGPECKKQADQLRRRTKNYHCARCKTSLPKDRINAKYKHCKKCVEEFGSKPIPLNRCEVCQIIFKPCGPDRSGRWCSKKCAGIYRTLHNRKAWWRYYWLHSKKRTNINIDECINCQQLFVSEKPRSGRSRNVCSYECYKKEKAKYQREWARTNYTQVIFKCKECGTSCAPEYGDKRSVFCSSKCQKRWGRKQPGAVARKKASNKRRRALKQTATAEVFISEEIYERDDWRCQLCNRRIWHWRNSWPHPRYPTIDHIIPLIKGGTHERTNVQTACFECNYNKREEKVLQGEQLLIV